MQQEMVVLRSKIDGCGPSNTLQGQNDGSSSTTIQVRTPFTAPNTVVSIATLATTPIRTSWSYITEEKLHEVRKNEAERASQVVAAMHFQPPYPSQVTSKHYHKDYVKPKFRLFDGKNGVTRVNNVQGRLEKIQ